MRARVHTSFAFVAWWVNCVAGGGSEQLLSIGLLVGLSACLSVCSSQEALHTSQAWWWSLAPCAFSFVVCRYVRVGWQAARVLRWPVKSTLGGANPTGWSLVGFSIHSLVHPCRTVDLLDLLMRPVDALGCRLVCCSRRFGLRGCLSPLHRI